MSSGWVCPQCSYVWAYWQRGCMNCNRPTHEKFTYTNGTTPRLNKDMKLPASDVQVDEGKDDVNR